MPTSARYYPPRRGGYYPPCHSELVEESLYYRFVKIISFSIFLITSIYGCYVTFGVKSNQKRGGCDSPAPPNAEYVPYCLTNSGATSHIRSQRARVLCVCRHIHIYYKERCYALSVPPLQCRGRCLHRPVLLFNLSQFTEQFTKIIYHPD